MTFDEPSGFSSARHPLDPFSNEHSRAEAAVLCETFSSAILTIWQAEVDRHNRAPLPPPEFFREALEGCLELIRAGTQTRLVALFERTLRDSLSPRGASQEAARLHAALTDLPMVSLSVLELFSSEGACPRQTARIILGAVQEATNTLFIVMGRAMVAELQAAQERQRLFFQEIVRLVTGNRLRLVEAHEVPAPQGRPIPIREPQDGSIFRHAAHEVGDAARMEPSRLDDLTLAVGEAVSNVLKHAGTGVAHVWHNGGVVYAFIADTGHGIALENLPRALTPGWSSQPSLGMGFTLMLEMSDTIWLATGAYGTTVCIEKNITPSDDPFLAHILEDDRY